MSAESSAPKFSPTSPPPQVINLSAMAPGFSEPFVAGPMFVRMCSRCGALILEGTRIVHDLWHDTGNASS